MSTFKKGDKVRVLSFFGDTSGRVPVGQVGTVTKRRGGYVFVAIPDRPMVSNSGGDWIFKPSEIEATS